MNNPGLPEEHNKKPFYKRLFASPLCWLIVVLLLVDVGFRQTANTDAYVTKFTNLLASSQHPDALVLGSSIAMAAMYYCDATFDQSGKTKATDTRNYDKAQYLQSLFATKLNKNVDVANMASAGMMASDSYLVVSKAIEFNKAPKIVIYETHPRDYIDSSIPDPGETIYCQALAKMTTKNTSAAWLAANFNNQIIDLKQAGSLIGDAVSGKGSPAHQDFMTSPTNKLIGKCWHFYDGRLAFHNSLVDRTCAVLHRNATLYGSAEANRRQQQGNICQDDIKLRDKIDWTSNQARFDQEIKYFGNLAKLCQDNHITFIVVNMPLTTKYSDLISTSLHEKYKSQIAAFAHQYGACVVDLENDPIFSDHDFKDNVHPNSSGGKKVQDELVAALAKDRLVL